MMRLHLIRKEELTKCCAAFSSLHIQKSGRKGMTMTRKITIKCKARTYAYTTLHTYRFMYVYISSPTSFILVLL